MFSLLFFYKQGRKTGYTIKRTSQYKETPFIEMKDYTTSLVLFL